MKILATAMLSLSLLASPVWAADKTPSEHFGQLPMMQNVSISPDGNNIAAVYNSENGPQVVVSPFGTQEVTPIVQLKKDIDRIDDIIWQNDDRLLIWASYSDNINGDRTRVKRLFTVSKGGGDLREVRKKAVRQTVWERMAEIYSSATVLTLLPEDKDHILMQLWSERDRAYSVFKVNPAENDFEKVLVNKIGVQNWGASSDGVIRLGRKYEWITADQEYEVSFYYRADNNAEFKQIYKERIPDIGHFSIEAIIGDKMYVVSDREIGRQALWLYDIPTAKYEKMLYSHDTYDVTGAIISRREKEVLGATYVDHYVRHHYFSGKANQTKAFVDASFPGYITWNEAVSADQNRVMVAAQRNDTPTTYFWLDIAAKKGGMWFSEYPYLAQTKMSTVLPYSFKASDGMELHGYLTLPAGQGDKKPKLVVLPHGGPQSRDYQYFDPWVQFLANRGYAVLQVNFRGSEGYGNRYEIAGYRQWGERMQQDVYDAIDWVGEQNLVDAKQSCVVGASYGGYVALTASFQRPNQFKCFVSIAGIPDLLQLAEDDYKNRFLQDFVYSTIGDPKDDRTREKFKSVSAMHNIDKIKKPILLMHGTHDTRVPYKYSAEFYDAAKKKKLDVQYIELKYGTHFLDEDGNRKAAFKALDAFLSKHL